MNMIDVGVKKMFLGEIGSVLLHFEPLTFDPKCFNTYNYELEYIIERGYIVLTPSAADFTFFV